jgi:hypothetical protein
MPLLFAGRAESKTASFCTNVFYVKAAAVARVRVYVPTGRVPRAFFEVMRVAGRRLLRRQIPGAMPIADWASRAVPPM